MPDSRTALLVMDVQEAIVERFGSEELLTRLQRAIAAARDAHIQVIYVKVGFRPGFPEISPHNRAFARIGESGLGDGVSPVHQAVAPAPGDIEVTKRRVSAFAGSDLDVILRAQEIQTLVLTGIATSGVVLSTLRAAADLDFELVVLKDCCADRDAEVHDVLINKVFPRQAEVLDSETWELQLAQSAKGEP